MSKFTLFLFAIASGIASVVFGFAVEGIFLLSSAERRKQLKQWWLNRNAKPSVPEATPSSKEEQVPAQQSQAGRAPNGG